LSFNLTNHVKSMVNVCKCHEWICLFAYLILGLYFILFGVVKCQKNHSEPCINYKRKEVILNTKTFLLASEKSKPVKMASGAHRFDFECQLPASLPASLEASHGYIRYHIAACLDIPWRSEKRFRLEFTVVRNDDLNMFPELKLPCTSKREKSFRGFCRRTKQLTMTAAIPFGGYTSGQHIHVITHFNNQSEVQVNRTKIVLVRKIRYKRCFLLFSYLKLVFD
jgi:Arrestin (or S-antigen), N-terminal domain